MLPFFRRIRRQLANDNKPLKYARYAIGEIVLVVIGILIALQINNWNQNRSNKLQENSILLELQNEYQGKLTEIEQKISIRNIMISASGKILKNINKENYNLPLDSLNLYLGETIMTPTYNASNAVSDELVNSGNLYLISNKELRKLISEWSGQLEKLVEEEQYLVNSYISNMDPFMNKTYPLLNLVVTLDILKNETAINFSKSQSNKHNKPIRSNKSVDIKALFNNLEFENYIGSIYNYCLYTNVLSEDVKIHIESVLYIINSELKKNQ